MTAAGKPQSDQRSNKRRRVLLMASVKTGDTVAEVKLKDLSRTGALIEIGALDIGSEVLFSRGTISVPATVAWAHDGRAGLEFKTAIDEHDLLINIRPKRAR